MANRTLTTWEEKPNAFGYHATARIERSAAGAPAGLLIIERFIDGVHDSEHDSESCVVIEDLNDFLGPVQQWLKENES